MDPSVRLGPHAVGRRVVVRRRLGSEHGRQKYGDVLGTLESWTGARIGVRHADGTLAEVDLADVVAGKTVPPPPRRSRSAPAPAPVDSVELERIAAAGWPAPDTERLGDWLLRAAGGFTSRGNSCLAVGDPGVAWPEAVTRVRDFYGRRGLPARLQVIVGSPCDLALTGHGVPPVPDGRGEPATVLVQAAPLDSIMVRPEAGPEPDAPQAQERVRLDPALDDRWYALFRGGEPSPDARAVLEGPERVVFASIGDPPVAVGRGTVIDSWLGLNAVTVTESERRRGLARRVVAALAGWGRQQGTDWAYLQVASGNAAACELYARLGFRTDHAYRYLAPSPA